MANINKWSKTTGSNSSADSDIGWAEGQSPSSVNNSARAMMQGTANDRDDTRGQLVSGGSTTAYTLTTNSINPTLQNGLEVAFRVNATSTGAVTLNVDGTGSKKVFDNGTSAGVQLVAGGLTANEKCVVQYETTADSGNGGWVRVSSGGTANTSGFKTTTGGSYAAEVTVASAATADVLGASADFVAISGTATITSLGSGANKLRVVRATGAFTLTHNATSLILPGAANRTFAAGDMFLVQSDVSSNARVFDISTADGRDIKAFTGDSGSGGAIGLVPAPATGDAAAAKFLKADGTWAAPSVVFSKSYVSSAQTITLAGALTLPHSLGVEPAIIQIYAQNVTAEAGYTAGDKVLIGAVADNVTTAAGYGMSVVPDATNINIRFGNTGFSGGFINKSTGALFGALTPANWRIIVKAWG